MNTIHHTEQRSRRPPKPSSRTPSRPSRSTNPDGNPSGASSVVRSAAGFLGAIVLTVGVFGGAAEHVISGSALLAFAGGWAMLALLSARFTSQPQRWARVPAVSMAAAALTLLFAQPDDQTLNAAGWVWPPIAFALAVWMVVQVRRSLRGRVRWLLYPVVGVARARLRRWDVRDCRQGARPAHLPRARRPVRRRRSPSASQLLGIRQPHRRARERARSDVGQLGSCHCRGEPHPGVRLRPRRSGLERRRRRPTGRSGHRCGPAQPARSRRRARSVRARRSLGRRYLRHDLRRPVPGRGRRHGPARLDEPVRVHRASRLRQRAVDDAPRAWSAPQPRPAGRGSSPAHVSMVEPPRAGGIARPGVRVQRSRYAQHARRAIHVSRGVRTGQGADVARRQAARRRHRN